MSGKVPHSILCIGYYESQTPAGFSKAQPNKLKERYKTFIKNAHGVCTLACSYALWIGEKLVMGITLRKALSDLSTLKVVIVALMH